jgi:hypothetical protein
LTRSSSARRLLQDPARAGPGHDHGAVDVEHHGVARGDRRSTHMVAAAVGPGFVDKQHSQPVLLLIVRAERVPSDVADAPFHRQSRRDLGTGA